VSPAPDENPTITDDQFDFEAGVGVGDNLSCTAHGGGITITCEEPWAGDSETGFGRACSIRLDFETARKLGQWLTYAATRAP
jgi:hypothetical protein